MLSRLDVVLFHPKYPENVGSAARACLNMGCESLVLVRPRNFDIERALPLATAHARGLLESARIVDDLPAALQGCVCVYGTTARTGGWRKGIMTPTTAAPLVVDDLRGGGRVAIVFGPEDRGLTNEETALCSRLVTIPTNREGTSLNLAQAVLIMVYECFKQALERPFAPSGPPEERVTTFEEREILLENIQEVLQDIDYLKPGNPDYWMMPVKRLLSKFTLKRNEFNLLMGICRQVKWVAKANGK